MIKLKTNQFIQKAKNIHGNKYDYSNTIFYNTRTKVNIICSKHGKFQQLPDNHIKGTDCPKCANIGGKLNNDLFITRANKIHNNKYDYSKVNYKDSHIRVTVICPEHGLFEQKPYSHLQGQGCKKCYMNRIGKSLKLTTGQFIEKAKAIHGDRFDYSKTEYIAYDKKIKIYCRKHKYFYQTPHDHLAGKGCGTCKASIGELTIKEILDKNNIEYIQEYRIPNQIYKFEYDFYLPKFNILIEFHGRQHFDWIPYFQKTYHEFEKQQMRDKNKITLAKELKYKFIEFNHDQLNKLSKQEFNDLILKAIK